MTERRPLVVALLSVLTLSLYGFYWLYVTTEELNEATDGRHSLSPILDVLLTVLTVGAWGVYAGYRNANIVAQELNARGIANTNQSNTVLLSGVATYFTGWAWVVGQALLQDELNRMARAHQLHAGVDAGPFRTRVSDPTPKGPMPFVY